MRILPYFGLLILDLLSKSVALAYLSHGGISLFQSSPLSFSLDLAFNTGAAWGFFQGYPGLLAALRSIAVVGFVAYGLRKRLFFPPLGLVAAGALGNVIDYLFHGHVIDFLHFRFWGSSFPIFNLADCYITIAIFLLLLFPKVSRAAQDLPS